MLTIPTPAEVNGKQLARELDLDPDVVWLETIDGECCLVVDADLDEVSVLAALNTHVPGAVHEPLGFEGRLITLLGLYEGQALPPLAELVKMVDGLTVEACQAEFYAWLEAGQA